MNEDHPDWGKLPPMPDHSHEDKPPLAVRFFLNGGTLWLLSAFFCILGQINYWSAGESLGKVIWAASYNAVGLCGFLLVCVMTALRHRPHISFTAVMRPPHE